VLVLIATLSACSESDTGDDRGGFVLLIDADARLSKEIDRVEISSNGTQARSFWLHGAPGGSDNVKLPQTLVIRGDVGKQGTLQVRAFTGRQERVRRTAVLTVIPGELRRWVAYLSESCEGRFESCEQASSDRQTCDPCTGECASTAIEASKLASVSQEASARSSWRGLDCSNPDVDGGSGGDPTMDASAGGNTGSTDANTGATDANMGSTDANTGGAIDGGTDNTGGNTVAANEGGTPTADLSIAVPAAVASGGCVELTLQRAATDGPASVSLSASEGTFHATNTCDAVVTSAGFSGSDTTTKAFYLAPTTLSAADAGPESSSGTHQISLSAGDGTTQAHATLEVRVRALHVSRGADYACVERVDGAVFCFGSQADGATGVTWDEANFRIIATPRIQSSLSATKASDALVSGGSLTCTLSDGAVACVGGQAAQLGADFALEAGEAAITPTGLGSNVHQLDRGAAHTCAVRASDRAVLCWGTNYNHRCSGADSDTPVAVPTVNAELSTGSIDECAAGTYFTCARKAGAVACIGGTDPYKKLDLALPKPAARLIAATDSVCIIATDGTLRCAQYTSCTNGTCAFQTVGLPTGTVGKVESVRLEDGTYATCASVGNDLYCWGLNRDGWLGTESSATNISAAAPSRVPLPAGTLTDFAIGNAGNGGLAISAIIDGLVYTWGFSGSSTLGQNEALGIYPTPVAVPLLNTLSPDALRLGCALKAGAVSCWGSSEVNVGKGVAGAFRGGYSDVPTVPAGLESDVVELVTGSDMMFARKSTGAVYAWGHDTYSQLGRGTSSAPSFAPTRATAVEAVGTVLQLSSEHYHACARFADGVQCWGLLRNQADSEWLTVAMPVPVEGLPATAATGGVSDIAAGEGTSIAVVDGAAYVWDSRLSSDLSHLSATPLPGFSEGVTDVEMRWRHLCVAKGDQVYCSRGGLPRNPEDLAFGGAAVSTFKVGGYQTCAVLTTGKICCQGIGNDWGLLGLGATSSDQGPGIVVEVSNADPSSLFVESPFACVRDPQGWKCWGSNETNLMGLTPWVRAAKTLIAPWP